MGGAPRHLLWTQVAEVFGQARLGFDRGHGAMFGQGAGRPITRDGIGVP
jgi:hypothetical protein